jgi:alkylhydroperoxidase family enzyme
VALEFAERFVLDHESIDDGVVERLRAHFDDAEVLELCACVGRHLAFGRITRVLRFDHDHCPLPGHDDGELGT